MLLRWLEAGEAKIGEAQIRLFSDLPLERKSRRAPAGTRNPADAAVGSIRTTAFVLLSSFPSAARIIPSAYYNFSTVLQLSKMEEVSGGELLGH